MLGWHWERVNLRRTRGRGSHPRERRGRGARGPPIGRPPVLPQSGSAGLAHPPSASPAL